MGIMTTGEQLQVGNHMENIEQGAGILSTNFYFRNKQGYQKSQEANKKIKRKIEEIIEEVEKATDDEEETKRLKLDLEERAEVGYEEIHIGRYSNGWKPSFERQNEFSSVKELKDFYQRNQDRYEIVDEYGDTYDWEGLTKELITSAPEGKENMHDSYKDEEGYVWHRYSFS